MNYTLNKNFKLIKVNPIAGAIGAEIENVDLSSKLDDEIIKEIYEAFLLFNVIQFQSRVESVFAKAGPVIFLLSI